MLGAEWVGRLRVVNHDARGETVAVGTTSRGNEVLIDRRVAEAGVRIALGLVEAHEFAGFTGGPKAILPAVSGYDTIIRNHSIAMLSHPGARPGVLENNPIHEEMCEAARLARLDFVVNVVLDSGLRPLAVAAGDPVAAQAELVRFVRGYAEVSVSGDAPDIVVIGPGRPLDINLYQSIKPLVAIEPFVGPRHPGRAALRVSRRDRQLRDAGALRRRSHARRGPGRARTRLHDREGPRLLHRPLPAEVPERDRVVPRGGRRGAALARVRAGADARGGGGAGAAAV